MADFITLTLMRHGESTYNVNGLYQGTSDLPRLTPNGREQAADAAERLSGSFNKLWVSPLCRALETAEIVGNSISLPKAEIKQELVEIDLPEWEGCAISHIKNYLRIKHRIWKFAPSAFYMFHSGARLHFPLDDILRRANIFLKKVRALEPGSHILAITHSGFIRALLVVALELNPDKLHAARIDNCAITRLKISSRGSIRLVAFNEIDRRQMMKAISHTQPMIVLTEENGLVNLPKYFPNFRLQSLAHDESELLNCNTGTVIAHGTKTRVKTHFEKLVGLPQGGGELLEFKSGAAHIFLPKGPSDPVRLWHYNVFFPNPIYSRSKIYDEGFKNSSARNISSSQTAAFRNQEACDD